MRYERVVIQLNTKKKITQHFWHFGQPDFLNKLLSSFECLGNLRINGFQTLHKIIKKSFFI